MFFFFGSKYTAEVRLFIKDFIMFKVLLLTIVVSFSSLSADDNYNEVMDQLAHRYSKYVESVQTDSDILIELETELILLEIEYALEAAYTTVHSKYNKSFYDRSVEAKLRYLEEMRQFCLLEDCQ